MQPCLTHEEISRHQREHDADGCSDAPRATRLCSAAYRRLRCASGFSRRFWRQVPPNSFDEFRKRRVRSAGANINPLRLIQEILKRRRQRRGIGTQCDDRMPF